MTKPIYSLDAPDQRRLKIARTEIEAILQKHDLGGVVVLHTPGMSEFFYNVQPSYSCAWIDEKHRMVRFKSLVADYGGDRQAQLHDQSATANLFYGLATDLTDAASMFGYAHNFIARATNAEYSRGELVADPAESKSH